MKLVKDLLSKRSNADIRVVACLVNAVGLRVRKSNDPNKESILRNV